MLESLFQMVKEYGQEQVVDNPEVPNEHNNAVMAEASGAVAGTLQNAMGEGNMQEVLGMFNSSRSAQIMSNPMAQNMQAGFMDNITSKLGIYKNVAAGLSATLIPIVIGKLVKRTNSTAEADNGFNLNSLIGSLTGGEGNGGSGGFDMGAIVNQFTGRGNNEGSGFDIGNLLSQVTQGAKQQQGSNGLSGLINGFFGK